MSTEENKLYFIGDIHGCIKTLQIMIEDKLQPKINDTVVFLGDYIDRGNDSKAVLDKLISYKQNKYFKSVFLRGNHDDMLLKSLIKPWLIQEWLKNGGDTTLYDFNVEDPLQIDDKYINFLLLSRFYFTTEQYVAVHAGMNFEINNPFDDYEAMMWKRNRIIETDKINGRKLIVGHTPVSLQKASESLGSDKIMLDGGCVYHRKIDYLGYLIAFDANSHKLISIRNADE